MARNAPTRDTAPAGSSLTPDAFSATVTAITSAFGDPTRRAIYLYVHEHDHGVTAAQVAEHHELHPNVARHHLDKLAAGGYLEVAVERPEGAGAGRPSKRYRRVKDAIDLDVQVRTDDLMLALLGRALTALPRAVAESIAEEVGQEYGRAMAAGLRGSEAVAEGHRSLRSAIAAVADALTAHGFAAHTDQRNDQLRIINTNCPFGNAPIENPVICAVDRGMVKGMLTALYGETDPTVEASRPRGDTICVTAV